MFFIRIDRETFSSSTLLSVKLVEDNAHEGQSLVRVSFSDPTEKDGFYVVNLRTKRAEALYEAVLHELAETEARTVGVIINEAPQQYGMFSEREITRPTGRGLIVDIDDILKGIDEDGK